MRHELTDQIEYAASGHGPTIVLVPGSCSTGAAWRPVMAAWDQQFRCITTSLLGYGRTAETRSQSDASILHETDMLESIVRRTGNAVHLVGHSFGGLVALAVALRNRVRLSSLVVIEPPAVRLLLERGELEHYEAFRRMTNAYFAAYHSGDPAAIESMIDFYGGAGTFAAWPDRVRAYAVDTTSVNILDWASAYQFELSAASVAAIKVPTLVLWGGASNPAMQCIGTVLANSMSDATAAMVDGAAHFMIATHGAKVASLIAEHVRRAESLRVDHKIATVGAN
jgi:pimeloyl-ACP methyl ester carboxylesterase